MFILEIPPAAMLHIMRSLLAPLPAKQWWEEWEGGEEEG